MRLSTYHASKFFKSSACEILAKSTSFIFLFWFYGCFNLLDNFIDEESKCGNKYDVTQANIHRCLQSPRVEYIYWALLLNFTIFPLWSKDETNLQTSRTNPDDAGTGILIELFSRLAVLDSDWCCFNPDYAGDMILTPFILNFSVWHINFTNITNLWRHSKIDWFTWLF